jgi:hydrophobic/amphiphilic exporter-1 (mainly G- bacteria), HAE1 family
MNLTRLFITRPTLVFVLIALMSFGGILSLTTLVRQLFPNVEQPTISINVLYNGASTTEMRDSIVAPIEQNLAGTTDLQTMNATVQQGKALISATFYLGSDIAADLALTQKAVQSAEKVLPVNITPPTISIQDPSESTVVTLGLTSQKLTPGQLSLYTDNVIVPKIEQIPGVSFVNVGGDVTPAYEVEVNPRKLDAAGLTLNDIMTSVTNENQRVPGGIAYEPNRETTIDVRGDIQDPASLANIPVVSSATAAAVNPITSFPGATDPWTTSTAIYRIGDIANVYPGNEPRRQYARIQDTPGLFLSVQKATNASEVTASDNVVAALPTLRRQFPDVAFTIINKQSTFTQQQIENVLHTLGEGVFLTGIVMLFFLHSWRNAAVVCIAIPTSLAIALTAMKLMNLTIDTISLLGMTLVIGILVDDSTVVLENIERHYRELHQTPENAAIEGRSEIGAAAVVITLVDVVVFLPIAFMPGQVGRQLAEFAIVVVIATLTSLFVSFTVTPTLAGLWALRSNWKAPRIMDDFARRFEDVRDWYARNALPWALRNGKLVTALCILSFLGSVALIPLGIVGKEYIPKIDRGQIYAQITFPLGTPLTQVRDKVYLLEDQITHLADVQAEAASAGGYSASFGGYVLQGNVAQETIFLKPDAWLPSALFWLLPNADAYRRHSTDWWIPQLRTLAHHVVPDAQVVVVPSTSTTGGNQQPIDYLVTDITGGDPTSTAQQVLAILQQTPGAISVASTGTALAPQVSVVFDRLKAQALDVDLGQAAEVVGAAFGGDVATQFETPQGLEEVQVIYPADFQENLDTLRAVPIRANNGGITHLSDFATLTSTPTAPLITRTDRNTVIHVTANIAPGTSLSQVQASFVQRLSELRLPRGVVVRPAPLGQQDFMNQTLTGLGNSLVLSVILVFLLMTALYNSYRMPFIIIFSVPVAAVGAIGALLITQQTLNLFSLIGTILLVGIATKNGILLVDYANTLRARGLDTVAAIRQSAHTRFRPIIMTSISIIAGNLPLALALEPGSQSRASLGIVVIGGVTSSLILTLLLIPIIYVWIAPKHHPTAEPNGPAVVRASEQAEPTSA